MLAEYEHGLANTFIFFRFLLGVLLQLEPLPEVDSCVFEVLLVEVADASVQHVVF